MAKRVGVIGAGWAGCSAALSLHEAGCHVTLFEQARTLGGRARAVDLDGLMVDNGQHIMLGAYSATLDAMRRAGVDRDGALLTLPLQMPYPPESDGMQFIAPRLPAPLHLLGALLRARGLGREDKMALARFSTTARWMDWQLHIDCSVSALLERFDQTPRLIRLMWRPLCLAALNTAPEQASARVFLNVLRDSLGARRQASDMLLPRQDLSRLFPLAVAGKLVEGGGTVRTGATVDRLVRHDGGWQVADEHFDAVVIATPPAACARLLRSIGGTAADPVLAQLDALRYEPITTVYLRYRPGTRLARPFYALLDVPEHGHWGQFVFDRGQLDPAQDGVLSVVISASGDASALGHAELLDAVAAQLAAVLGQPQLASPMWARVITEKRATFACTPALARPDNASGYPGLALAGDYTSSDYPATLEAAVRSGALASALVTASTIAP